jgi:hypothetical protein
MTDSKIVNFIRRKLFSTALLQEQLIDCCCHEAPPPSATADVGITKSASLVLLEGIYSIAYTINVTDTGPSMQKMW